MLKKVDNQKNFSLENTTSKTDRETKQGGRTITISKPLPIPGQKELPENTVLHECNDGYYKVGDLHYRVGKKIIDTIKE